MKKLYEALRQLKTCLMPANRFSINANNRGRELTRRAKMYAMKIVQLLLQVQRGQSERIICQIFASLVAQLPKT